MNNRFLFQGAGDAKPDNWKKLQRLWLDGSDHPAGYHIEDRRLIAAVNTALTLGMPLLVTGKPGVGKTQLAHRIAYEMGCGSPILFAVKSTSEAENLFYHVDHLRRLYTAQVARRVQDEDGTSKGQVISSDEGVDIRHFLRFQGLGLAILRALPQARLEKLGLMDQACPERVEKNLPQSENRPSVVLIDEIDKAPDDFCNDILEEIRKLEFFIPELSSRPISL